MRGPTFSCLKSDMADHLAEITTEALQRFLDAPGVTDVSIHRPGEIWVDDGCWRREKAEELTAGLLHAVIDAVANRSRQSSSEQRPLLSAELPGGERLQVVRPPVAEHPVLVIRKPAHVAWNLDALHARGVFDGVRAEVDERPSEEIRAAYGARDWVRYLTLCVRARRNVVVSGPTGSGKTTLLKAIACEIPQSERVITIEDVLELSLPHENVVRLRYSKGAQGLARSDPRELLEACLRMRPDRILFGELRGGEAFQFLRNVNSGHPGSVTSVHANSPLAAIDQIALLARQSEEGRGYGVGEMRQFVEGLIDVVVQMRDRRAVAIHDRMLDGA